jgi:hypothetical protein
LAIAPISVPGLALGLGLGLGGPASAAATSRGSALAVTSLFAERTVVISCLGRPEVRPGSVTLACADGNDYLTGLSWTSWTPRLASGYGTQVLNDCLPTARPVTSTAIPCWSCCGAARRCTATREPCATRRSP